MKLARWLKAAVLAGLAGLAWGAAAHPEKFWPTVLLAGFYVLGLSLGAAVFSAIQRVCGARWSAPLEVLARALLRCYWPAAAAVFVAVVFGRAELYGWTRGGPEGWEVARSQRAWLAPAFLLVRTGLYLAVWGAIASNTRTVARAALFLVVFGVTASLASFDWLMALEPGWSSTMFGVYVFAGILAGSTAAIAVAAAHLRQAGRLDGVGERELHNLGKLLFGFTMFWAYIWYCQYMLIWYANISEETVYFARRTAGGWSVLSLTSIGLNWLAPFAVLLPEWSKRRDGVLLRVGLVVLAGHWLDLYIAVMPRFAGPGASFGAWEGLVFLGCAAAAALAVLRGVEDFA